MYVGLVSKQKNLIIAHLIAIANLNEAITRVYWQAGFSTRDHFPAAKCFLWIGNFLFCVACVASASANHCSSALPMLSSILGTPCINDSAVSACCCYWWLLSLLPLLLIAAAACCGWQLLLLRIAAASGCCEMWPRATAKKLLPLDMYIQIVEK